ADLRFLTDAERRQLLVEWNAPRTEVRSQESGVRSETSDSWLLTSDSSCIHELFEAQAARTPDAVALVFEDRQLSYAELNARANQVAHHLRALGVDAEARVALCMGRSLDLVIGMLGILKAGGAYVPLDPSYPAERIAFMLQDSGAAVVL